MLHLIPAPLHRAALHLAHRIRKRWWKWRKSRIVGVNVILRRADGAILLVRHSYEDDRWTFPGGGLKRGELPDAAARRELREELGCPVAALVPIGARRYLYHGADCLTHFFSGESPGEVRPGGRELAEARFFAPDRLPSRRAAAVDAGLAMLTKGLKQR